MHSLGSLIEFEGGSQPDKGFFRSSWKPGYVRLIQIRDYKSDRFETYIPAKLARRFCSEADIMIGRYGPPVFQILRGIKGAYNVALIKAKPHAPIQSEYAYYFLTQDKLFDFIEKLSQRSSGQTGVDLKELRQYPLPLPATDAEQQAIAEALTDADALIESLEQLLTKKRHLKQATMQELLTGKRRLYGFSGEWRKEPLRAHVKQFIVPMRDKPQKFLGEIPWCRIEDFDGMYLYDSKSGQRVDAETVQRMNLKVYPVGTLLVSCSANLGRCAITANELISNQTFIGLVFDIEQSSSLFFYYLMVSLADDLNNLSSGTTISYLSREQFEQFAVYAPFDKDEQTAIAEVLNDQDAEIRELESQLAKTRALKQGMMQKLLTGEIRLI